VIPTIAAGFFLLAALLLWVVLGSGGRWPLKLGAIVVCSAFTFAVWDALDSFSGWPTREELPKRALHVAGVVVEPHSI
jgi:hypothetical protein